MARTGSPLIALLGAFVIASPALAADVEFYMTTDRAKVGVEDLFHLEIIVGNAPQGAVVQFPTPPDFEVVQRSESTQMSFSAGSGGAGSITSVRKHTLTLHALHTGRLTIPAAQLQTANKQYKTEPITIEVVKGRLNAERRQPPRPTNPFGLPPGFGNPFPDDDEPNPFQEPDVPTSDSDLFLRATVDKTEVMVGEQLTYTMHIYARLDLSSVDGVKPPKLDGFYSADLKVPTTLVPEQRVINGVPYREYLLRSRALFALKPGTVTIEPAEADITTGMFFAGRRLTRKSNAVTIKVNPLPKGGNTSLVGQWRMSREVTQTKVALGEPVQVKVRIEGKGNLQGVVAPSLNAPAALHAYDPETKDTTEVKGNALLGQRSIEYTLVPQQTGTFELPAMRLEYFDPATRRWQDSSVDPIAITVTPGANGATATSVPNGGLGPDGPKNQLVAGGLKSLRHSAHFAPPAHALWGRRWFAPLVAAPPLLTLLFALVGFVRGALEKDSPESRKKKQASAARRRLSAAAKLLKTGSPANFYAEVERALLSFLEARLSLPLAAVTRPELGVVLEKAGKPEAERARILAVLETCDMGRYAPGMGEASARQQALDDAAKAMELWT